MVVTNNIPTLAAGGPVVPEVKEVPKLDPFAQILASWADVSDPQGRYKLKFPSPPMRQGMPPILPGFAHMQGWVIAGPTEMFSVAHQPLGRNRKITDEQMLTEMVDGSRRMNPGMTLSSAKSITYQDYPGRELVLNCAGKIGPMILRVIVAPDRMIVVTSAGDAASPEASRVQAFFQSLKIDP